MRRNSLDELKGIIYEINDINMVTAVLGWDQETYMPKNGIQDRANQLSTLSKISHEKFTAPKVGELIEEAKNIVKNLDSDSDSVRFVKILDRNYTKTVKVPSALVAEMSKASSEGMQAWAQAKEKSDFNLFKNKLQKIVDLKREYSSFFKPFDNPYDPLLDDFEPGLKTKDVSDIFNNLKKEQVHLISKIKEKPQVNADFITKDFDETKQWEISKEVISNFGYNWNSGRMDKSAHPFTTSFGINDVRITTRINKNFFPSCFFGCLHEAGHAMYEQGIDKKLARTPLAAGASLSIHESQSRLWENLVGRSRAFWTYMYPKFRNTFPSALKDIQLENFYKAVNRVSPSLIRVEADEATYNLHIMLRFEVETKLIANEIEVTELPSFWNTKMQEYLGVTPKTDRDGVLQDIHWSMGAIGYFSTYALGNLVSAQLWESIEKDIPDIGNQISKGIFTNLFNWLREKVHKHGAKYEPQELVEKITGSKITSGPYIRYLTKKYSEIYNM